MTIETNQPEHPICIVDEVLLYEHLYLNKAVLRSRSQSFLINKRLPFMSADRIHRHLTLTSGQEFYKLRKVSRAHVVFLSNLKLRVLDEDGKV